MGSAYKSDPLPPLAGFATAGGSSSNSVGDADGMSFNLEAMRRAAYGHVNPRRPDTVELRDEVPAGARRLRAAPHGGAGGVWRGATGGEGGQERCASMNHSRASLSNQMAFTTRVHLLVLSPLIVLVCKSCFPLDAWKRTTLVDCMTCA